MKLILLISFAIFSKILKTFRNITIHGNITLNYYYLDAYIGTPPQIQSLIIDTGSHMTIIPCEGCSICRDHQN